MSNSGDKEHKKGTNPKYIKTPDYVEDPKENDTGLLNALKTPVEEATEDKEVKLNDTKKYEEGKPANIKKGDCKMEKSVKDKYMELLIKSEMWDSAANLEAGDYLDAEAVECLEKGIGGAIGKVAGAVRNIPGKVKDVAGKVGEGIKNEVKDMTDKYKDKRMEGKDIKSGLYHKVGGKIDVDSTRDHKWKKFQESKKNEEGEDDMKKAEITDKKAKAVFEKEYEKSPVLGVENDDMSVKDAKIAGVSDKDLQDRAKKKLAKEEMEKADNVKTIDKSMIDVENPKNKEVLDKKDDEKDEEKETLEAIVRAKTKKKMAEKMKPKAKRMVEGEEEGKAWALGKSIEYGKTQYNTLGQWELKKNSDMGEIAYEIDCIYEDVICEANKNDTIREGLKKHEDAKIEKLVKTAICLEINKIFSGKRELELKKNDQIEKIEALEKSLFSEPRMENEAPSIENEKPSREDIARDLCWKLNELKELVDKKWSVESEFKFGDNKDEKTFEKIKKIMENKYKKLREEIKELADKWAKVRLVKNK